MNKNLLLVLVLLLSVSLFGCTNESNEAQPIKEAEHSQQTDEADKEAVASLVESFGSKLQNLSLQAPQDILNKSIQENYSDYVSPALLAEWLSDPQNVPGRTGSSPWPDRIEILTINKLLENTYEVQGEIIEISSMESVSGGVAAKRPITLEVKKVENRWLIDAVTLGAYQENNTIVYKNTEYGFNFSLPKSWQGYSILTDTWEGFAVEGSQGDDQTGPQISIRHPQWTSQNQRQDIPIMIFSLAQWESLQREQFHIGAAPVGPSELGRNTRYVFALPARYNYAFPTGYEEVVNILKSDPLQAIDDKQMDKL